jgi:nitrogen fixation protein NifB
LIDTRKAPEKGLGDERWKRLSRILNDCRLILVSGAGEKPRKILSENGIEIVLMEGLIDEVTNSLFQGKSCRHLVKREKKACAGTGTGCM